MRVVTVARKPCASSSTTANVVEHEAGAINIDSCRWDRGSWPVNVIVVGTWIREALDAQSGQLTSGTGAVKRSSSKDQQGNRGAAYGAESRPDGTVIPTYGDTGGASRYYKCFDDGDQHE